MQSETIGGKYTRVGPNWRSRLGTWCQLSTADGRKLGGLRVDGLNPANTDASWRLDRVHRDLGGLRLPGLVNVIDQFVDAGQVWLIADATPLPTVTHMRAGGVPMPGDVALVIATETGEILRLLHAAGQAHGDLGPHNVIVTAAGGVLVAEAGLAHALVGTTPGPGHDTAAWSMMVADLADTTTDRRVEGLLRQAAAQGTATGAGLASALATLSLAAGSVNRETVRAVSTSAATIAISPPVSPVSGVPGGASANAPAHSFAPAPTGGSQPTVRSAPMLPEAPQPTIALTPPAASGPAQPTVAIPPQPGRAATVEPAVAAPAFSTPGVCAPDAEPTVAVAPPAVTSPALASPAVTPRPASAPPMTQPHTNQPLMNQPLMNQPPMTVRLGDAGDDGRTVMFADRESHSQTVPGSPTAPAASAMSASSAAFTAPAASGTSGATVSPNDGDTRFDLLEPKRTQAVSNVGNSFGMGPTKAPPKARNPRSWGRRVTAVLSGIVTLVLVGAAAWIGWQWWQKWQNDVTVSSVAVAPAALPGTKCDTQVDIVGTINTNGKAGTISYRWVRSDGQQTGVLKQTVSGGQSSVKVHLYWRFSGHGTMAATATLNVLSPTAADGHTTFTYACK